MSAGMLTGRVAIVTGAGGGIGREIALAMAREGARVVVNDLGTSVGGEGRNPQSAEAVAAEIRAQGFEAVADGGDVSSASDAAALVDCAMSKFGALDIVVNNAGILRKAAFCDIDPEEWDRVMKVNLYGVFNVSQAACRVFLQQKRGTLVHMTSTAGLIGATHQAHYSTSKLAVSGVSRAIALEMHADGIRSNCISPIAATRMMSAATGRALGDPAHADKERGESGASIAPMAVYLASDRSSALNGQIVGVRGSELYLYNQSRPVRVLQQSGGWSAERIADVLEPAWKSAFTPLERTREVLNWPAL